MTINFSKYKSNRKVPDRPEQSSFIGTKWGGLTVISKTEKRLSSMVLYECICDCGESTLATMPWLKRGQKKSCGCKRFSGLEKAIESSTTHNMSSTATYKTWQSMWQRCSNPKSDQYKRYGGRGIKVCDEWNSFERFLEDMGERPEGKTLDRIDTNGNYNQLNCRWANSHTQSNNRISAIRVKVGDDWVTASEAAKSLGLSVSGVRHRYKRGTLESKRNYGENEDE